MAWPPSLPYPAQSITCSRPDSAPSQSRAACALAACPPRSVAPPAAAPAAPIFRSCWRLSRRSIWSCSSIPVLLLSSLVAWWADDPHHFGELLADVRDSVRRRAAVVDAVASFELQELAAEVELDGSREDDEQLFRVAVCVGLLTGRPANLQLSHEDLEVMERPRRQQQLPAENSERKGRAVDPPQHAWARHAIGLEQVCHRDAQRVRDAPQGRDAGARPAALHLAQKAFAEPRARRDRPERAATEPAQLAEPLADVDLLGNVGRAQRHLRSP